MTHAEAQTLTLYFVRHGRTTYNDQRRLQGWADSELTASGLEAVRLAAQALSEVPFVAAYTSSSPRAVTTAREILRFHPTVVLNEDERLREFSFGDLEAAPEDELFAVHDAAALFKSVADGEFPGLPGAEPTSAYLARLDAALDQLRARGSGDVLVVTHGVSLFVLLARLGLLIEDEIPNAAVISASFRASEKFPVIRRVAAADPAYESAR